VSKKLGYFRKGYTRKGRFNETVDLPEVNFVYRPLTMYETAQLSSKVLETEKLEDSTIANLEMLATHLVDWDLMKESNDVDSEGNPKLEKVDFTDVEELKLVSPLIMNHIIGTVRGDHANPLMDIKAIEEQVKN
jgi:hypothetical protein